MSKHLSVSYALEWITAITALVAAITVIVSFIDQHYIIPTVSLINTILLGHLARAGLQRRPWARYTLFWAAIVVSAHGLFALFWAKQPAELLGDAFVPVYAGGMLLFAFLAWHRGRELFGGSGRPDHPAIT